MAVNNCGNETLGFIACGDNSWLAEELLAPQEGPCYRDLVRVLYNNCTDFRSTKVVYVFHKIRISKCPL